MRKYRGWKNRETFLVHVNYGDLIEEEIENYGYQDHKDIRELVENDAFDCELIEGLLMDFLSMSFDAVNWHELESQYNALQDEKSEKKLHQLRVEIYRLKQEIKKCQTTKN